MKKGVCLLFGAIMLCALTGCVGGGYEDATDVMENVTEEVVTKSFIGTVIEETDTCMYVEPDEGEEERALSDKIGVFYTSIHSDYFYGEGRRVVVYYKSDAINENCEIMSDDISTEGFRDFELSVNENGETKFDRVLVADEENKLISFNNVNVSTYGVEIKVIADGKEFSIKEAFEKGIVTPQAITARANRDVKLGRAKEVTYRDGGSREYIYEGYKIIKYHTTEGKRDLYIGNLNLKYMG